MAFFLVCFGLAAGAGLINLPLVVKIGLAVFLLAAYAAYVIYTIKSGSDATEGDPPDSLTLWPFRSAAPTWAVAAQVVGMVTVMGFAAHFFVDAVGHISSAIGIPAGLIALVLAPLATELPEKFNSVIWLRDNKDTLALGNITGAMVFQSTVPVAVGVLFTPWELGSLNLFSVALALLSGSFVYAILRHPMRIRAVHLMACGAFYLAFVVAAVFAVT
jgi:cation:H+ antiporter